MLYARVLIFGRADADRLIRNAPVSAGFHKFQEFFRVAVVVWGALKQNFAVADGVGLAGVNVAEFFIGGTEQAALS